MLTKAPQKKGSLYSKLKLGAGIVLVGELAFLGFSFTYFRKMNNDIELRKKIYKNVPWFSEMYYRTVELMPADKTIPLRQTDYAAWGVTDEKK